MYPNQIGGIPVERWHLNGDRLFMPQSGEQARLGEKLGKGHEKSCQVGTVREETVEKPERVWTQIGSWVQSWFTSKKEDIWAPYVADSIDTFDRHTMPQPPREYASLISEHIASCLKEVELTEKLRGDHLGVGTLRIGVYFDPSDQKEKVALVQPIHTPLNKWLETAKPSLSERIDCAAGMAKGTLRLHNAGTVHADLRPPNILINQEGKPIVADLGASSTPEELARLKERKTWAGAITILPESLLDKPPALKWVHANALTLSEIKEMGLKEPQSIHTDVYAFGKMTYDMFLPLEGELIPHQANKAIRTLLLDHLNSGEWRDLTMQEVTQGLATAC